MQLLLLPALCTFLRLAAVLTTLEVRVTHEFFPLSFPLVQHQATLGGCARVHRPVHLQTRLAFGLPQ
jgi:hypothetical protein